MMRSTAITRREWRRVAIFAAFVMLLTTLPYAAAWGVAGHEWTFGGFLFGAEDGYSYLAKMRLGARGEWLFTLRHTTEPHQGALLFLPHVLLGKLTGLFVQADDPGLSSALVITYHAARVLLDGLLIGVTYRFVACFLPGCRARGLALLLITFGGGLALALPTSAMLWLGGVITALSPATPVFWPQDAVAALDRLNAAAPPDARALAPRSLGSFVPVRTDLRAYIGHGPETLDGERKQAQVARFFADEMTPDERRALLDEVDYVLYGPLEPDAPDPSWAAGLNSISAPDGTSRYRVYEVPHGET